MRDFASVMSSLEQSW
uniref:Uncharacterized protein n=1 Tax=Arundo donax TaxID=35708 RepID=A0A0A8Y160_ARUDO